VKVGIVCPYDWSVPGGVQVHVRDLAVALQRLGHDVSVLAPSEEDTDLPDYVVSAGPSISLSYNGSKAKVAFGPVTTRRVRRWLRNGDFDVLHIHEPLAPSVAILSCWAAKGPIVATWHSSMQRSRALAAMYPLAQTALEKVSARIAVSEAARQTLVEHMGGDAVVIPNGVYVDEFESAAPDPRWVGTSDAPTVAFLGRLDEPRKGLLVLFGAVQAVLREVPGTRFLIAGLGETGPDEARALLGDDSRAVEFLGSITDAEKASLLRSVDVYCAPQTGGESFGIVLVEAMSAGAAVVASDLGAFRRVLDEGGAGTLFRQGDSGDLASTLIRVLRDPELRATTIKRGAETVRQYDWSVVTRQILAVYEMVLESSSLVDDDADVDPAIDAELDAELGAGVAAVLDADAGVRVARAGAGAGRGARRRRVGEDPSSLRGALGRLVRRELVRGERGHE